MHYQYCLENFQQCPSPLAVGPKGTGKTTAGKVFLALVGQEEKNLARKLTVAEAISHCSKSSFPYIYDDLDDITEVKSLINNTFNGQVRITTRGTWSPKTGCMLTANTERLLALLSDFQ